MQNAGNTGAVPRLRRADCSSPGLRRRRRGRGFEYLDENGARLTDRETLERIGDLAIPPAWDDVWICPDERGHLQATGIDAAGRKQYLYHPHWRRRRDQEKFDRMLSFGRALPKVRRRVAADLAGEGLGRERVLACAVRLLDRGFFRIGSEEYADSNGSFGLATMRKEHVSIRDGEVFFDYPAKSGQRQVHSVVDEDVREIVDSLRRRRGGSPELLAYKKGRRWVDVRSTDINEYLKEIAGEEFSAKDFRTWNATLLAALALAVEAGRNGAAPSHKRAAAAAVKQVSGYLGNTPAVCRSSYIDPRVFDLYRAGSALPLNGRVNAEELTSLVRPRLERELVDMLSDD
jgi:DNA topoisomerase IB